MTADQTDAEQARERRRAAIETAFRSVFGTEGHRSTEQMVVMTWLASFCQKHRTTFNPNSGRASIHFEGRREVLLEIERRTSAPPLTIDDILGVKSTEVPEHDD